MRAVEVPGDDFLPEIGTLERPEELTQRPPYRLVVRQEGRQRVLVEASHMGTLKVLEGYLGRWVRGNVDYVNRVSVCSLLSPVSIPLLIYHPSRPWRRSNSESRCSGSASCTIRLSLRQGGIAR
jgi:hypothetical protein